jgi:glycosyltransferase involved in cell wall biosynthesis
MPLPKITLITPSYNQAAYLEQTLDSVLSQGYPNLEYFVLDGGSKDKSAAIIKKYEKHLSYWVSEPDKGQSDAINKGLQRASGEIINWLNSDDYYQKDTLFKVADSFQAHPDAQVLLGRSRLFKGIDETVSFSQGTDVYAGNLAKTIGYARIDQPETFFRKTAIDKMGLLDANLHYLMDRDWWIKYLFHFGLEHTIEIEDILVNFRLHDDSKTVSQQGGFITESLAYYAGLAQLHGLENYSDFLMTIHQLKKYHPISHLDIQDLSLVEKALNYYLLLKADEAYFQSQYAHAKKYLNFIKPNLLAPQDQALYQKLSWRIRFLPQALVKLMRKWRK